jgi:cytochrome P450
MFDQPDLEALLRHNLERYPRAELRGGVEVTDVVDDGGTHACAVQGLARLETTAVLRALLERVERTELTGRRRRGRET